MSDETRATVANRGAITVSIMLATFMQGVDTTIANVALPHMQGSFSAAQDQIERHHRLRVSANMDRAGRYASSPAALLAIFALSKQINGDQCPLGLRSAFGASSFNRSNASGIMRPNIELSIAVGISHTNTH